MLGRSVTFGPKSVEKRPQQENFFELTTPIEGVEGDRVMKLEVGGSKTAQDRPVIREYCESSSLDLGDEVSNGQLDGQKFSPVGVEALLRTKGFAPESQWDPRPVDPLVQAWSQAVFGCVGR